MRGMVSISRMCASRQLTRGVRVGAARCAIALCALLPLGGAMGVDTALAKQESGVVLTAKFGPVIVAADNQTAAVNDRGNAIGQIALPSPSDCPYFHFHGTLFGRPDPAPQSCGWGPFIPIDEIRPALFDAADAIGWEELGQVVDAEDAIDRWIKDLRRDAMSGLISTHETKSLVDDLDRVQRLDETAGAATDPKKRERLKGRARKRKLAVLGRMPYRALFKIPKHKLAGGGFVKAVSVVPNGQLGNPPANYDVVVDGSATNAQWDSVEVSLPPDSTQSIQQFLVQGENSTCVLIDSQGNEYQPKPPDNHYDVPQGTKIVAIRCKRSDHRRDFNIALQLNPTGNPGSVGIILRQKHREPEHESVEVGPRLPK